MNVESLVDEIKLDLGFDINSLGISDDTIKLKIKEAVRKISSYSPYVKIDSYNLENNKAKLPENTVTVIQVLTSNIKGAINRQSPLYDETDLFNASRYIYNYSPMSDPYIYMMNISEIRTLQNMVALNDWFYNKGDHYLYINNAPSNNITVKSLETYTDLEKVTDIDMIQYVKEYALALCKIVEGNIRRKLQSAPGSIQMDGDSLVSEGMSEKSRLDEEIPKTFSYLRFGLRV